MPSPIAHVAVGALVAKNTQHHIAEKNRVWRWWIVCLFFSMAPDLDAVAGILMGDLGAYHNQATHSLLVGFLFCAASLPVVYRFVPDFGMAKLFGWLLLLYGLHLGMDAVTHGRGLKLLWPWSEERFISPVVLFYGFRWSEGLISPKHVITAVSELVFAGLLFAVYLWGWGRRATKN